jgi:beta-lactamase regulating signal transducer with metallopeptidase domain
VALAVVAGAGVRLSVLGLRLGRLRRYRRLARPFEDGGAVAAAAALVGSRVEVRVSDAMEIPATFGAVRPLIVVPAHFTALDERSRMAVLCHEMLHARRHDWLHMLAEEAACALLWFHPALWWLVARIRLAREQVVDQQVVRLTGQRRVYLEVLVSMARRAAAGPAPATLFLTESDLDARVRSLMKEATMGMKARLTALGVSMAGVALVGVAVVRALPLQQRAAGEVTAPAVGGGAGAPAGVTGNKADKASRAQDRPEGAADLPGRSQEQGHGRDRAARHPGHGRR